MKHLLGITFLALSFSVAMHAATLPKAVSRPNPSSATGHGDSFAPTFSPDGRFIVFVSRAKNLTTNGAPSPWLDVFRHDLETHRTELVSVNTTGVGGGNGNSSHPSVSSNGLFVTFQSSASNLVAGDMNGASDVFVRDIASGITTVASVSTNGENANANSGAPLISADGRWISFESIAWNLFPNDTNGFGRGQDIVMRDRLGGTNLLITINSTGTGSGVDRYAGSYSQNGGGSDDARFIVFRSTATNLTAGDPPPEEGVFLRDVTNATTYLVSTGFAYIASIISADGSRVFSTVREGTSSYKLIAYDVVTGVSTLVASNLFLDSPLSASGNGRFVTIATSNSLSLFDTFDSTFEVVCDSSVMPELKSWRSPVISADGQRVAFVGSTNVNGSSSVYVYHRGAGTRQLVSVNTNGEAAEVSAISEPVISRDGRFVAFESRSANIVAGDFNNANDIFVRDLSNNTTICVSAAGVAPATAALASSLRNASATALARVVAFTSVDHSLDANDDNTWRSAFIHDRFSGTNRVLATAATRALGPNRLAFNPIVSTNGRYASWYEVTVPPTSLMGSATNIFWLDLQTGAERALACSPMSWLFSPQPALSVDGRWLVFSAKTNGSPYAQVFRRDMFSPAATDELLSYKQGTNTPASGDSFGGVITSDQKWVVFSSRSLDVGTNYNAIGNPQIVARNLATRTAQWVSMNANGQFYNTIGVSNFIISGNSRYVFAQVKQGSYPNANDVYRHDLKYGSRSNLLACSGCLGFSVSDDGNLIAYINYNNFERAVYVRDFRSNSNTMIAADVGIAAAPFTPLISADGRYVVFGSAATNLVASDTNNAIDIFVHDRVAQTTLLVSRNNSGAAASGSSSQPMLAPDGRTVLFSSSASDLVTNDFNNARDIFVVRLGGEDSDLDGMDDDWEAAYFNTLSHDGSGDFDGDGATDLQEFQAGTDPTNVGSVFRVLTVEPAAGNSRLVIWNAQVNRTYRVEFKDEVTDEFWQELGSVPASGSTASLNDPAAPAHRIYRVVLQP